MKILRDAPAPFLASDWVEWLSANVLGQVARRRLALTILRLLRPLFRHGRFVAVVDPPIFDLPR